MKGLAGVEAALERFTDEGRAKAYRGLYKAGRSIAKDAQTLGRTVLHGPMHAKPIVREAGSDAVSVSLGNVRPQTRAVAAKLLKVSKRTNWPKALR